MGNRVISVDPEGAVIPLINAGRPESASLRENRRGGSDSRRALPSLDHSGFFELKKLHQVLIVGILAGL